MPATIVATMTGLIVIMTSIFEPMSASPSATVTSASGGAPARGPRHEQRAARRAGRRSPTAAATARRLSCTMLIGISAGFIPMNMTM